VNRAVVPTSVGTSLLATRGLVSGYGRVETLHGVDVDIPGKGITAIIGPNGSGKSTLLKAVSGLIKPWSGSVTMAGEEIAGVAAHKLVPRGMCVVPQGRVVFPLLTVAENLRMSAFTVDSKAEIVRRIDEVYKFMPALADRRHQLASSLSGGEQVMLALAKVLMLKPRLLLVDEPSLGLSPMMVEFVYERLTNMAGDGLSILLVEQNVRKALEVSDQVIVLVLGEVRYCGTPQNLEGSVDLGTLFVEGKLS